MTDSTVRGSASLQHAGYWWYRARADLLRTTLEPYLGQPRRLLDVGSADAPSVPWMRAPASVQLDVDPRGLTAGTGVCGSAVRLPFRDATFEVVGAFDVVEHCDPEAQAMHELARVLVPGGRLLMSVPAYQWAWTDHDVLAGHHRRYTRRRLLAAVEGAGFDVLRCTHVFAGVFPFFAAERLARKVRRTPEASEQRLPQVSPVLERVLMGLSGVDRRLLGRVDLPFGSSIVLAALKPG